MTFLLNVTKQYPCLAKGAGESVIELGFVFFFSMTNYNMAIYHHLLLCFAPGELLLPLPGIVHCPCFWKTPSSIFYTVSEQNWMRSRCHVWAWRCEPQVVICEPGSRRGETGWPMFYPPSPPPPSAAGKTSATPNYLGPLLSCNCTGWVPNSTEWAPWQTSRSPQGNLLNLH